MCPVIPVPEIPLRSKTIQFCKLLLPPFQLRLLQKPTGLKHHQRVRALYRWAQIILSFSDPELVSVAEQSEISSETV